MSDEISRLSGELARDPSSLVFLELGEALRRRRQLDLARRVATRGLERHPDLTDAHDLLARIHVDAGDLEQAFDEWDVVLRLDPSHAGALKGMGFVRFREGRSAEAEELLAAAAALDGGDAAIAAALSKLRATPAVDGHAAAGNGSGNGAHAGRATGGTAVSGAGASQGGAAGAAGTVAQPADFFAARNGTPSVPVVPRRMQAEALSPAEAARRLFAEVIGEGEQTGLLLDGAGLIVAGSYPLEDGRDVAPEVGAELCGVREEAERAVRHLQLGEWQGVVFETEIATVAMAPVARSHLMLIAAAHWEPLGFVKRVVARCADRARLWLEDDA